MIRVCKEEDLGEVLAIYAPYVENTTISFEFTPPTLAEFTQRYRQITQRFPWLVYEENGKILGYAYASAPFSRMAYGWCTEPSIYLLPEARGRGIGKSLYATLERILVYQGFQLSYAIITGENQASLDFHRACGYHFLAEFPNCGQKFNRRLGIIWMEKALNPVSVSSSLPTFWEEIAQDAQNHPEIFSDLPLS